MTSPDRPSTGGPNVKARDSAETTPGEEPRRSAADVRRTIVMVLGPDRAMTPKKVEHAVSLKLSNVPGGLIKTQLQVLEDGLYVHHLEDDSRQIGLTDQGRRWFRGIRALNGNERKA